MIEGQSTHVEGHHIAGNNFITSHTPFKMFMKSFLNPLSFLKGVMETQERRCIKLFHPILSGIRFTYMYTQVYWIC